jgi:hypothetical protein
MGRGVAMSPTQNNPDKKCTNLPLADRLMTDAR